MGQSEIERFVADLKSSEALAAEVRKALADVSHVTPVDRVVTFAARKAYAFISDEAKEHIKATAKAAGRTLADAELGGVPAGASDDDSRLIFDPVSGGVPVGDHFRENTRVAALPWETPSWKLDAA